MGVLGLRVTASMSRAVTAVLLLKHLRILPGMLVAGGNAEGGGGEGEQDKRAGHGADGFLERARIVTGKAAAATVNSKRSAHA